MKFDLCCVIFFVMAAVATFSAQSSNMTLLDAASLVHGYLNGWNPRLDRIGEGIGISICRFADIVSEAAARTLINASDPSIEGVSVGWRTLQLAGNGLFFLTLLALVLYASVRVLEALLDGAVRMINGSSRLADSVASLVRIIIFGYVAYTMLCVCTSLSWPQMTSIATVVGSCINVFRPTLKRIGNKLNDWLSAQLGLLHEHED